MEFLYSNRGFRNIRRGSLEGRVRYEEWTTGWFPRFLFEGEALDRDFVNFLVGM